MSTEPFHPTNPAVRPFEPFNPVYDAKQLRKAMKGLGTDEVTLIRVIAEKSNSQRQQIAEAFQSEYNKKLIKEIKSETSGAFARLLVALMTPVPKYYAKELKSATAGLGTDEDALVEIMLTLSNKELEIVKEIYEKDNKTLLVKDIKEDTSGGFKKLMTEMCKAKRDESELVDVNQAKQDAEVLLAAADDDKSKLEVYVAFFSTKSYKQLHQTFQTLEKLSGESIEKIIKKEFSGDLRDALLQIVKRSDGKAVYLANRIHDSMKNAGTNERSLIRIVAARSEIDLRDIQAVYYALYAKKVDEDIKDDTSGDFKKLLLEILQEM